MHKNDNSNCENFIAHSELSCSAWFNDMGEGSRK